MASAAAAARLKASARAHRRQLARRLGIPLSSLDGLTAELVWVYARAKAAQAHVDPDDSERYFRAANATGRALVQLERRLVEVGLDGRRDGAGALAEHVRRNYGNGNGGA